MRRTLGRFTSLAVVAATAVFLGCEESPTSLDSQLSTVESPELSSHAGNPVVLSARGSGHSEGPGIGGAEVGWRTFTFNAAQRLDGTAKGNMQYNTHDQGDAAAVTHRQQGRVICMTTIPSPNGDIVLVGLEGTQRSPDDNPTNPLGLPPTDRPDNHGMFFAVRDNGEGSSATGPDQFTGVVHTVLEGNLGFGQIEVIRFICANPAALGIDEELAESFFNDVEAGNIQVSP